MVPAVKAVLDVETIRDGGSLAATFRDEGGSKWILLLQIDQIVHESTVERLRFKKPALIDTDPARRPIDTESDTHSELSGSTFPLTWEEARALVEQIAERATTLTEWAARSLNYLRLTVGSQGELPPGIARSSPIQRLRPERANK